MKVNMIFVVEWTIWAIEKEPEKFRFDWPSVASGYRKGQDSVPGQSWIVAGSFSTALVALSTAKIMSTFIHWVILFDFMRRAQIISNSRKHINRLRLPKKTKELCIALWIVALFISGLKWTCKDFSFRSPSIETHRWMALRTVNQVTKWVDWAVLILGASSGRACLSNLCFIYAYTLTMLFPCGRL